MISFPFLAVSVLSMSKNIKVVLVYTMTNPKSVFWQLTMFWWTKYYQMTTIFFYFGFFINGWIMDLFSQATVTIDDLLVHLVACHCLSLCYCYGSESGENIKQAII